MYTFIVGDIHGHVRSVEAALALPGKVVFVGDFLDSFHQSVDDQIKCLVMVLDAVETSDGRVTALLGNHEMSYLVPDMRCSGWKHETAQHVIHLKDRMEILLDEYVWVNEWLISHAGVDQELLTGEHYENVGEYLITGDYQQIGHARGGYANAGGLYWNDFNREMIPPNGLKQVVGHSNWRPEGEEDGVRVKYSDDGSGEVWCVDNLNRKAEVLLIEGCTARPYPL